MAESGNVIIVGMMGAGKTTVGKALARRLGKTFVDSDEALVSKTGVPIATIFDIEGEDGFRDRETILLAELLSEQNIVLSTGGGAVIRPENRRLLKEHGVVVYLHALADDLWRRTRHDRNRPLLRGPNPLGTIRKLVAERDALYRETAHIVVETGRQRVDLLVDLILAELRRFVQAAQPR